MLMRRWGGRKGLAAGVGWRLVCAVLGDDVVLSTGAGRVATGAAAGANAADAAGTAPWAGLYTVLAAGAGVPDAAAWAAFAAANAGVGVGAGADEDAGAEFWSCCCRRDIRSGCTSDCRSRC